MGWISEGFQIVLKAHEKAWNVFTVQVWKSRYLITLYLFTVVD